MKKHFVLSMFLGILFLQPGLSIAEEGTPVEGAPLQERSFGQKVMDGYHSLRNNISEAFGGYSGESEADQKLYMEHYREDLGDYHEAVRKARAKYRRARLDDQKAYLEHHNTLPMTENIDSIGQPH